MRICSTNPKIAITLSIWLRLIQQLLLRTKKRPVDYRVCAFVTGLVNKLLIHSNTEGSYQTQFQFAIRSPKPSFLPLSFTGLRYQVLHCLREEPQHISSAVTLGTSPLPKPSLLPLVLYLISWEGKIAESALKSLRRKTRQECWPRKDQPWKLSNS